MKVLLVEHDKQVVKHISLCLHMRYPDATIVSVAEGRRGIDMIEAEAPDLVMVAASLPETDSLDFITKIREFSDVPLIILFDGENDMDTIASALEAGSDEYITKPFSPLELLAKVNAVLRRTQKLSFTPARSVSIGGKFFINFATHEVLISGKSVKLTPTEYALLSELVRNGSRVVTHRALLERVWGSEYSDDHSFVKKYVYRLRSKIELDAKKPQMLMVERGVGYKFVRPA